MQPGSVIVDLAAERGGNCELTEADQTVTKHNVTIIGNTNIPALIAYDASLTYSRNLLALVKLIVKEGKLNIDLNDEVIAGTMVTRDGEITHPMVRERMGLPASISRKDASRDSNDESMEEAS
jgi:NAD(P) transhydrogenase subunit alpha